MNILHQFISCDSPTPSRSKKANVALKLFACCSRTSLFQWNYVYVCCSSVCLFHWNYPKESSCWVWHVELLINFYIQLIIFFFFNCKINSNCNNGLIIHTYCCSYFHQNSLIAGVVVHWIWQIRGALDDQDQPTSADILCPIDEYEFWKYRCKLLK